MIHVSLQYRKTGIKVYIFYFQHNFLVGAGGFDATESSTGAAAEKKPEVNIIYQFPMRNISKIDLSCRESHLS